MILVGSKAIKHWFPDFKRQPADTDWIVFEHKAMEIVNGTKTEYLYNPVFKDYKEAILDPDSLYTLKVSHLFWNINWEKHIFDAQFLQDKGCELNISLFWELYNFWSEYHPKIRRSNLDMTSSEFFNNALPKEWSHDWLHTLINPIPIYTKILKEGAEVDVCETKFNKLSFEDKLELVREEVYVMAWERFKNMDYRVAYNRMLKKFIISHAPVWEALFIIQNHKILHKPQYNYIEKINTKIENDTSRIKS